jgi:uncharacterized protein
MLTAGDIHTFTACPRWTFLDFNGDRRARHSPSEFALKLQADGQIHESAVLSQLSPHRVSFDGRDIQTGLDRTRRAMEEGRPRIAGAVLATVDARGKVDRFGVVDLLEKVPGQSTFGDYIYEPVEIKNARRIKRQYRLQLAFYADLLSAQQGSWPVNGHLILSDKSRHTFLLDDIRPQYQRMLPGLRAASEGREPPIHVCGQCTTCPWRGVCLPEARETTHLSLVYGLQRKSAAALIERGIATYAQLAAAEPVQLNGWIGCGLTAAERIVGQAQALVDQTVLWCSQPELPPSETEIFFDIEGDPEHDALYLFGALVRDREGERYRSFLAERPEDENKAFVSCLEFLESLPKAPIYHYHHYERTALGRLIDRHGVAPYRIEAVLPRPHDLNSHVTESCYLPISSYSLKAVARYLGFEWSQEDSSAVQSVVWFSSWLKSGNRGFLNRAIEYNADDCRATRVLKDWLTAGPSENGKPWAAPTPTDSRTVNSPRAG